VEKKKYYLEPIEVESYSGYKLHESPRKFIRKKKQYIIQEIMDRWYEGGLKPDAPIVSYFKIRADDGKRYLIRYDSFHDEWMIVIRPVNQE
jgi:hypothetical protein